MIAFTVPISNLQPVLLTRMPIQEDDPLVGENTVISISQASFSWNTQPQIDDNEDSSQQKCSDNSSKKPAKRSSQKSNDPLKEPLLASNGLEPSNSDSSVIHQTQETQRSDLVLNDIDFQLKRSSLTAVCGAVRPSCLD